MILFVREIDTRGVSRCGCPSHRVRFLLPQCYHLLLAYWRSLVSVIATLPPTYECEPVVLSSFPTQYEVGFSNAGNMCSFLLAFSSSVGMVPCIACSIKLCLLLGPRTLPSHRPLSSFK